MDDHQPHFEDVIAAADAYKAAMRRSEMTDGALHNLSAENIRDTLRAKFEAWGIDQVFDWTITELPPESGSDSVIPIR